jgi:predicted amidohydrolase
MRIAAFQRPPLYDDLPGAGAALLRDLRRADAEGVDLALFPECGLHGHSYDGATIARRALRSDGPELTALLAPLSGIAATVIAGAFERHDDGITNSAFVIERGRIVGRTAKAHPNEDGVRAGDGAPIFARGALRFGIAICNDANYPETAERIARQGAALICYPLNNMLRPETADTWRSRSIENLQARARQTGCWIASADVSGSYDGLISHGCTAIVAPDGTIMARAVEGREGVALFDIDV